MERVPMIVAGFGCRAAATPAALQDALQAACARLPGDTRLAALAAPTDRLAQLAPLAAALQIPLVAVDRDALRRQQTPTRSPRCLAARGCGSVAEAAALYAAGKGARLLVLRQFSPDRTATCAMAIGESA
jgi:cobalt-precorrin 5A hydrolase